MFRTCCFGVAQIPVAHGHSPGAHSLAHLRLIKKSDAESRYRAEWLRFSTDAPILPSPFKAGSLTIQPKAKSKLMKR